MMTHIRGYTMEPQAYLGKSEHGVYYTTIYQCKLRVWVLLEGSESPTTPKWVQKHHSLIAPSILRYCTRQCTQAEKTDRGKEDDTGNCEWEFTRDHSDDDSEEQKQAQPKECQKDCYACGRFDLLGYHPYKEIAFLGIGHFNGFAYYMGTSKLRYLGPLYPMKNQLTTIRESFIYTPCEDDLLPTNDESV
jgi:hypothetical protein